MVPRVILHAAVSADGRTGGFSPDLGKFYGLISRWKEDVTLAGSDTILASPATRPDADDDPVPPRVPGDARPLLAIPDSRGRVRCFGELRAAGYWRDVVVLCSRATPPSHLEFLRARKVETIVAGDGRVDFAVALGELGSRFGAKVVRADSGGTLNGVLLRAGLVSEVSLLVHPALAGGASPRSFFHEEGHEAGGAMELRLLSAEPVGDGIVWLRYGIRSGRPEISR